MLRTVYNRLPYKIRKRISQAAQRVRIKASTDLDGFKTMSPGAPAAIDRALENVKQSGISGDYLEFGLFRGRTFWHAQQKAKELNLSMRFFGFDSFAGLPEPKGIDARSEFNQSDYACSKKAVEAYLNKYGVDWQRTFLIEGFYDVSLTEEVKAKHDLTRAAIVLIDCDLYLSAVPVLNFIAPLLQSGTILLFDDWNCFNAADDKGERKAFGEFLSSHPEWKAVPFCEYEPYGQGFIIQAT